MAEIKFVIISYVRHFDGVFCENSLLKEKEITKLTLAFFRSRFFVNYSFCCSRPFYFGFWNISRFRVLILSVFTRINLFLFP